MVTMGRCIPGRAVQKLMPCVIRATLGLRSVDELPFGQHEAARRTCAKALLQARRHTVTTTVSASATGRWLVERIQLLPYALDCSPYLFCGPYNLRTGIDRGANRGDAQFHSRTPELLSASDGMARDQILGAASGFRGGVYDVANWCGCRPCGVLARLLHSAPCRRDDARGGLAMIADVRRWLAGFAMIARVWDGRPDVRLVQGGRRCRGRSETLRRHTRLRIGGGRYDDDQGCCPGGDGKRFRHSHHISSLVSEHRPSAVMHEASGSRPLFGAAWSLFGYLVPVLGSRSRSKHASDRSCARSRACG
jgi:hypothetical protein